LSYRAFGYELIEIPADGLARRVAAVRSAIS
jgi:predicted ATPase